MSVTEETIDAPPPALIRKPTALDAQSNGKRRGWWRPWNRYPRASFTLAFLAILAAGTFLRFWLIGQQSFWCDEVATAHRVSGTAPQVIASLHDQGFPPGWYYLVWGYVQSIEHYRAGGIVDLLKLYEGWLSGSDSPLAGTDAFAFHRDVLRLLPAFLGTLMVPAMYFLARQFTDRKGALLIALLAAVNPYWVYYSRDMKMYMAAWLMVAIHTGLFFKWLSTHRHWPWWFLFALSGAAMVLFHGTTWVIILLEIIWLLSRPRLKWMDAPLWVLGLGLMALIPVWWYALGGTNWVSSSLDNSKLNGLEWMPNFVGDMDWKSAISVPCVHVLGYLWPIYPPDRTISGWFMLGDHFNEHLATRSWNWLARWQRYAAIGTGAIMVLGLVPWRGFRKDPDRFTRVTRNRWWWVGIWIVLPLTLAFLASLPEKYPGTETPNPWSIWPHKEIWEPRYMGFVSPALVLWLGASLRRLPTWPVRTLSTLAVVGVCVVSALSSHLTYRQMPYAMQAEIAGRFIKDDPHAVEIAFSANHYTGDADLYEALMERNQRPLFDGWQWKQRATVPEIRSVQPEEWHRLLHSLRRHEGITTLIMTDRDADLATGELTDQSVGETLGPSWKLADIQTFTWHYEWRFYIFNRWRTRVWQRLVDTPQLPAAP